MRLARAPVSRPTQHRSRWSNTLVADSWCLDLGGSAAATIDRMHKMHSANMSEVTIREPISALCIDSQRPMLADFLFVLASSS
jgi:hypothetical protein